MSKMIRISHHPSGECIAEGPRGWGITHFEGNYYIRKKYLRTSGFRSTFIPGFCPYKFLYVWLDLNTSDGSHARNLGWLYWLPNPMFPFIWFRVAVPGNHPDLSITEVAA